MQKNYPILYDTTSVKFNCSLSNTEILYLFQKIFNRTFQEDILEWYAACPQGGNIWYGAFNNDTPIGMYALLPMQFRINNQLYDGALCNNVGVVPEFQGKGLFQALGQYALQNSGFPIVAGVPNSKAVKGHKRIGWRNYGTLELLHGEVFSEERPINNFCKDSFTFIPSKHTYQFSVNKDLNWLKWRYSKPGSVYTQSVFQNGRYVVWKEYENKRQVLQSSDHEIIFALQGKVDIWQFSNSLSSDRLKERGFTPILKNEFILYLNSEIRLSLDIESVKFELADNDVF
jgi:hypothetical protein